MGLVPRGVCAGILVLGLTGQVGLAEPLDSFRDCDVCPEMIELPLGVFTMGAQDGEWFINIVFRDGNFHPPTAEHPFVKEDELPRHRVNVDTPFAIGRDEVTYAEWMACVEDGGCNHMVPDNRIGRAGTVEAILQSLTDARFERTPSENEIAFAMAQDSKFLQISGNYPVLFVSYEDAETYVDWLNQKLDTDSYRLPTEAEWEYAARAGTTTRFAQGEEITSAQANFSGFETEIDLAEPRPDLRTLGFPVPVDELDAANAWGIRHMSGNAAEMTASCYTKQYHSWLTTSEWLEKSVGSKCERAVRGGSFVLAMNQARVAWRSPWDETWRTKITGFRVVKELR